LRINANVRYIGKLFCKRESQAVEIYECFGKPSNFGHFANSKEGAFTMTFEGIVRTPDPPAPMAAGSTKSWVSSFNRASQKSESTGVTERPEASMLRSLGALNANQGRV
jgi:hypothetical protein